MLHERRRSPRVELVSPLSGESLSVPVPVQVRDMSLGGLALESDTPFVIGDLHSFRITLGDGTPAVLRGEVVYSRRAGSRWTNSLRWMTGIRFLDEEPATGTDVASDILDRLTPSGSS